MGSAVGSGAQTGRLCQAVWRFQVNPYLEVDTHPLHNPGNSFVTLAGGVMFFKLDLAHAYKQVLLDDEKRTYVTVNTHRGLFQHTRLPFGIASAPTMFQEIMDKLLQEIPGVVCNPHDILISGSTSRARQRAGNGSGQDCELWTVVEQRKMLL